MNTQKPSEKGGGLTFREILISKGYAYLASESTDLKKIYYKNTGRSGDRCILRDVVATLWIVIVGGVVISEFPDFYHTFQFIITPYIRFLNFFLSYERFTSKLYQFFQIYAVKIQFCLGIFHLPPFIMPPPT